MNTNLKYIVSCNHVDQRWQRNGLEVECRPSKQGEGQPDKYYVSIPGFGCSKDYLTPQGAIRGMLQDHACTDIKIVPASMALPEEGLQSPRGTQLTAAQLTARAEIERIWKQTAWADRGVAAPAELVVSPAEWAFYEALLAVDPLAGEVHVEEAEFGVVGESDLIKRIQDALGTAEEGDGLVEVARNACAAEREKAGEAYQGFPNHETWVVHLWLTQEQHLSVAAHEIARAAESVRDAGRALEDSVPDMLGLPDTGMIADVAGSFMRRIEWEAIAESLRAD